MSSHSESMARYVAQQVVDFLEPRERGTDTSATRLQALEYLRQLEDHLQMARMHLMEQEIEYLVQTRHVAPGSTIAENPTHELDGGEIAQDEGGAEAGGGE